MSFRSRRSKETLWRCFSMPPISTPRPCRRSRSSSISRKRHSCSLSAPRMHGAPAHLYAAERDGVCRASDDRHRVLAIQRTRFLCRGKHRRRANLRRRIHDLAPDATDQRRPNTRTQHRRRVTVAGTERPARLHASGAERGQPDFIYPGQGPSHGRSRRVRYRDVEDRAEVSPDPLCVFTFAPTPTGAYSRMFAPDLGVVEDPATGSSTGPLALYMKRNGLVNKNFVSEQGKKMGRRSLLHVRFEGDHIDVGGYVTPIITAELHL
jgi:hypothetical protein